MNKPTKAFPTQTAVVALDRLSDVRCFLHATTFATWHAVAAEEAAVLGALDMVSRCPRLPKRVVVALDACETRVLWAHRDAHDRWAQTDGLTEEQGLGVLKTWKNELACLLDAFLHTVSPFLRHRHAVALVLWHQLRVQASYAHAVRQHLAPEQQQVLDAQLLNLRTSAMAASNARV